MVDLKKGLSILTKNSFGKSLKYEWLGRFDQQVDTKFHLDNSANESFLLLGYEPTEIESELYIADYVKCALDHGIEPAKYFDRFNPVIADHAEILEPYTKKIPGFRKDSFRIVLINNSNSQPECETLGVLHMARIKNADADKSRIVNSMMLTMVWEKCGAKEKDAEKSFLLTDNISK